MTDFKKNPNGVAELANGEPFAVLTNNRPSFYVISPEVYELAAEQIEEAAWQAAVTPEILEGLKQTEGFTKLNLDEI